MNRRDLAKELMKLIAPEWRGNVVVAGGFAASPELANDIDLWVLGVGDQEDVWTFTADMEKHFKREKIDAEFEEGATDYPDVPVTVTPFKPVLKFASLSVEMPPKSPRFGWMPVQIMATAVDTVDQLLETFDLSVHKHAWRLDEPEEMLAAEDATWPSDQIMKVTRFDTPERTYQRAQKLHARYGTCLSPKDFIRLQLVSPAVLEMVRTGTSWPVRSTQPAEAA